MRETTLRYALPLLASGQAQKEITHNEALLRLDSLIGPTIESHVVSTPPSNPQSGQMWLVATAATGEWADKSGSLAVWTDGGWRYTLPQSGLLLWSNADQAFGWYDGVIWHWGDWPVAQVHINGQQVLGPQRAAISDPTGGATVDTQARATIQLILQAMRGHGLIAS